MLSKRESPPCLIARCYTVSTIHFAQAGIRTKAKKLPSLRLHTPTAAVSSNCLGAKDDRAGSGPGIPSQNLDFKDG